MNNTGGKMQNPYGTFGGASTGLMDKLIQEQAAMQQAKHQAFVNQGPYSGAIGGLRGALSYGADAPIEREKEIPRLLQILGMRLNELESRLVTLDSRLEPVLRNVPEGAAGVNQAREAIQTPLANALDGMAGQVSMLNERVDRMLRQLEI